MNLTSLLLRNASQSSNNDLDKDLDRLFQSNPVPPSRPTPIALPTDASTTSRGKKRKRDIVLQNHQKSRMRQGVLKQSRREKALEFTSSSKVALNKSLRRDVSEENASRDDDGEDTEDEDEQMSDLERTYLVRKMLTSQKVTSQRFKELSDEEEEVEVEEDSDDPDAPPPIHETHTKLQKRLKKSKREKYLPPDETHPQRDARTVFVGNVAAEVIKSKSVKKQLKRHFLSLVPEALIESMRFRSVAFSTPTGPTENGSLSTKVKRQVERTAQWRELQDQETEGTDETQKRNKEVSDVESTQNKPALSLATRKRIAFFKHEFHQEVDAVNAYIVFGHKSPIAADTTNTVHPTEAARLAVERGHGTVFMERTIRVDRVGQWQMGLPKENLPADVDTKIDHRSTIFVGNLDFAAKDEELRVWFESIISKERGPLPSEPEDGESARNYSIIKKRKTWVEDVRIIRDRDTQLGKGFAYVRFTDRGCVDEMLSLEPTQLKFAKRTLRIQRCKGIPSATPAKGAKSSKFAKFSSEDHAQTKRHVKPEPVIIPKGDPNLGTKLAGLSKEERKVAKAADMARIQRRLAKKRAKATTKLDKSGAEKLGRDRERRRKVDKVKNTKSKGRVRSEKSIAKRNTKK